MFGAVEDHVSIARSPECMLAADVIRSFFLMSAHIGSTMLLSAGVCVCLSLTLSPEDLRGWYQSKHCRFAKHDANRVE